MAMTGDHRRAGLPARSSSVTDVEILAPRHEGGRAAPAKRHLRLVLAKYVAQCNGHRPHRTPRQNPPAGRVYPPGGVIGMRVLRRDRIGALIHEYAQVARCYSICVTHPSLGTAPGLWRCDIVRKVDLDTMRGRLNDFVIDRGWQHLHTPKNLASAIAVEAGELLAIFQWMTPEESWQVMNDAHRASLVRDELIDVLSNLLMFATALQIDFGESFETKLIDNAQRYPVGDQ